MTTTMSRKDVVGWALALAVLAFIAALRPGAVLAGGHPGGPSTAVAYIATGENYPDALAMSTAAALGLGPVLLVQQNSIPAATLGELNRLAPPTVVIVGGTAVISAGVEGQLNSLAYTDEVIRIGGANRYATAAAVSEATFPTSGLYPRAVAYRTDFAAPGGAPQRLEVVPIIAPAPGLLLMTAGFITTGTGGSCWITSEVTGSGLEEKVIGSERFNASGTCGTEVGLRVDAGMYEIGLRTNVADGVFGERSISVLWVPFYFDGSVPVPE